MLNISIESIASVRAELESLLAMHWEEIAVWQDIPLAPCWETYYALENSGNAVFYSVRDDQNANKLVGYAVFFLRNHLHYKNHRWALNDIIWVHPDCRDGRIGRNLVNYWEKDLQSRGVHVVHVNVKVAHPALGLVLKWSKYKTVESGHEKRLN
jgi:ribosomal protein S18 acetylase RimI-like enzyme